MFKRWKAKWIWGDRENEERNLYYCFRKRIHIADVSSEIKICISAETKYKLYINGRFVSYGSIQSQPYYKYYDEIDVTEYLLEGENTICVHAYYLGTVDGIAPGLLCEMTGGAGEYIAGSDSTWKCKRDEAHRSDTYSYLPNIAVPFQEHFDAGAFPTDWLVAGYDDSEWEPSKEYINKNNSSYATLSGPWSNLVKREIPLMLLYDLLPEKIRMTEEHIGINARSRHDDISINLSAKGKPVEYSEITDSENLLKSKGTAVFKSSSNHMDKIFDGYYNPSIVLDFGKVITAGIKLELTAEGGQIIDIGYAERLIDGEFNNTIEGSFADRYITRDGVQTFESYAWKGFRYVKLLFRRCFSGITLVNVKAAATMYPYDERGKFTSSDMMLDSVFEMCRYTVKLCSNENIVDTPFREQGQWLGDPAAVTNGAIFSCFGDTKLVKKYILQSAQAQMPTGLLTNRTNLFNFDWQRTIPDFSLWWVLAVWDYYMYSGDEDTLQKVYPAILKIIDAFIPYIDENGLICNMPYWVFIDWADIERAGECCALNAIYYGALEALLKIAAVRGDSFAIGKYRGIKGGIKESFTERFFNHDIGLFSDANVDGKLSEKISEQSNVAAVYFVLDTSEDEKIIKRIIENLFIYKKTDYVEAQPFYTKVTLQALKKIGEMDLAVKIIGDKWGNRMVNRGAKSCYEEWYLNGSWREGHFNGFMRTNSHAWSAHPAEFLIKDIAGIEIAEAGCKALDVSPYRGTFDYDITYPTPLGDVRVE